MSAKIRNTLVKVMMIESKQVITNQKDEVMRKEEKAKMLARIGENTQKYPKIGVCIIHTPLTWVNVEKATKQIKEDKLGDMVRIWIGGVNREAKTTVQEQVQNIKNWVTLCKQNGLFYAACSYDSADSTGNIESEYFAGYSLAEISTCFLRFRKTFDGEVANMQEAKEGYMRVCKRLLAPDKKSMSPVWDIEEGPIGHNETLGVGTDICSSEHSCVIGVSMSSARGASKAYEKQLWTAFLNVECYASSGGWGPPQDDSYTPAHQRRLMLDYNMSYIYGANLIVLQDCLFDISIWSHYNKNKPTYDMDNSQCRGFREKAKEFYRYVQTHPRSEHSPAVDIGLAWGNLEGIPGNPMHVSSSTKIWWQSRENWKATIEQGWSNLTNADLFSLSHPLHHSAFRYTGAPCGQVDITPIRAPIDVLQKYKTLMFLGWNTMTPEIYGKLKEYVKNGGTLFMSLPQLSQQIERKPELELINNGDFRDLFGVTVKGKLERKADEKAANVVRFDRESSLEQCKFLVGTTFELGNITIPTDFVHGPLVSVILPHAPLAKLAYPENKKEIGLKPRTFSEDFLNLHPELKKAGAALVYYAGNINCAAAMKLNLLLGYDGPVKVWIDGKEAYYDPKGTNPAEPDTAKIPFNATKGTHEILVALDSNGGRAWGIFMRFERHDLLPLKIGEIEEISSIQQKLFSDPGSDLEWADVKLEGVKVLASVNDGKIPVLIENKFGKGTAFLMTSYSFSPAPVEFVKPLVVGTVKAGEIELLGELDEKKDINYAVYPGKTAEEETKILLVNIDWTTANNVKNVKMRIKDMVMPVEVKEGTIKTINVLGDMALTVCDDLNHCLSLEKRDGNKYTGKLSGQGVCVIKGVVRGGKAPQKVTLDGKDIYFQYDPATHMFTAECNLFGEHVLEIQN